MAGVKGRSGPNKGKDQQFADVTRMLLPCAWIASGETGLEIDVRVSENKIELVAYDPVKNWVYVKSWACKENITAGDIDLSALAKALPAAIIKIIEAQKANAA